MVQDDYMTWKEKCVCRILLVIAKMISTGDTRDEMKHLYNHINCAPMKPKEDS
jgi:hypothetical protein